MKFCAVSMRNLPGLLACGVLLAVCWSGPLQAKSPVKPIASAQQLWPVQVHTDLIWTHVDGQPLKLDIYQPISAQLRPVVLMLHGGGWLVNDKHIMQQSAAYLARRGGFVVVNADYRLLGDQQNQILLQQIVNDALGAVVWVKQHIRVYGGAPEQVAVTGDSAGGHLAAMTLLAGRRLGGSATQSAYLAPWPAFTPSYLPAGISAQQLAASDALRLQAAVLSYPVLDTRQRAERGFETSSNGFWRWGNASPRGLFGADINVQQHPLFYQAASPQWLVPLRQHYQLAPQLIQVGSLDTTTPVSSAQRYVKALQQAGQPVRLQIFPGLAHAYLDNACPRSQGICAWPRETAPLDQMIVFLRQVFAENGAVRADALQ